MIHALHKKPLFLGIIFIAICIVSTTAYAFTASPSLFSGKGKVVPNAFYAKQLAQYEIFLSDVLPDFDTDTQTDLKHLFVQNIFDIDQKIPDGDQKDSLRDLVGMILDRSMDNVAVSYLPIISPFDVQATTSGVTLLTNEKARVILSHVKSNTASSTAFIHAVLDAYSVGDVYRELYSGKYFTREISSQKTAAKKDSIENDATATTTTTATTTIATSTPEVVTTVVTTTEVAATSTDDATATSTATTTTTIATSTEVTESATTETPVVEETQPTEEVAPENNTQ